MPAPASVSGFLKLLVSSTLLMLVLLLSDWVPLGIPGEWVWSKIPISDGYLIHLFVAGLPATFVLLLLMAGSKRLAQSSIWEERAWLAGMTLAAMFMPLYLCQSAPGVFGLQRGPLVLYYPMTSGYFLEAKKHTEPLRAYLKQYPEELRKGDYLHLGTHPPGLILLYRTLHAWCDASPVLRTTLHSIEPVEITQALDFLTEQGGQAKTSTGSLPSITTSDRHVLWLRMVLGSTLLGLIPICVYLLLKKETTPQLAWWFGGMSIFLPGVICFFPKSDTLYPCFSILLILGVYQGLISKRFISRACIFVVTGFMLTFSLLFSLALLPVGLCLGLWIVLEYVSSLVTSKSEASVEARGNQLGLVPMLGTCLIPMFVGFLVIPLLLWVSYDVNLFEIWMLNLKNHAAFYEHNQRHYLGWLLMNLLELTLTLGMPVVCLLIISLSRFRFSSTQMLQILAKGRLQTFSCSVLLVWGLLWLSGKNMGEALRLWIFWTPLWLVVAGNTYHQLYQDRAPKLLLIISFCQILICIITAMRIDSFGFTSLYKP